jgi:cob(I)alamin adenosyltransferase
MADAPEPAPAASSSAPRKYRVYTRTGDKGTSSLYNGQRRPKDDAFFEALGGVDELNSAIGLAREYCALASVGVEEQLVEIQSRLIDVGSTIATPRGSSTEEQVARVAFSPVHAEDLEKWIDAMDDELPALKNFILPVSASRGIAAGVLRRDGRPRGRRQRS